MISRIIFLLIISLSCLSVSAQQPKYTVKRFASELDTTEFKSTGSVDNGFLRSYLKFDVPIWDVDDDNTTHVRGGQSAVVCVEGNNKKGMREGIFTWYLIDSANHSKRYKIWEQTYEADHLNGEWRDYNLKGVLIASKNFKNDSLNGIARDYWIDGKTLMKEREYFNSASKYLNRDFQKNGKPNEEIMIVDNKPNGECRKYYPSGIVKSRIHLKNGVLEGLSTYYYPDGKPWIEEIFKNGLKWTVVANYDSKGNKRDPGTLKDGNGTLILYDDDVKIREVVVYKNGVQQK